MSVDSVGYHIHHIKHKSSFLISPVSCRWRWTASCACSARPRATPTTSCTLRTPSWCRTSRPSSHTRSTQHSTPSAECRYGWLGGNFHIIKYTDQSPSSPQHPQHDARYVTHFLTSVVPWIILHRKLMNLIYISSFSDQTVFKCRFSHHPLFWAKPLWSWVAAVAAPWLCRSESRRSTPFNLIWRSRISLPEIISYKSTE